MIASSLVKICSLLSCFSHKSLGRSLVLDTVEADSTPQPCYFANVPVEILISIFSHAIDGRNETLFALCGVCRQWREILFDVPHVWKNLILTGDSYWTPDKVDAWLNRAKGSLSRLYIRGECEVLTEDDLYKRIPWSSLQELCIVDWRRSMKDYFLPEIATQLQVESFVLSGTNPDFPSFLGKMKTEGLRSFVCKVWRMGLPLVNIASSSLTKLELSGEFSNLELLLVLLDRNPMIERMVLADAWTVDREDPVVGAGSIKLVHLTHFELYNCYQAGIILRAIRFPNVKTLILHRDGETCTNMISTHRVSHLEEFHLVDTDYDHRRLIPLLRNALALKTLAIRSCRERRGKGDLVIQALAEVIPQESITTPSSVGMLCCPQLQEFELWDLHKMTGSLLLGLVRARLNGVGNSQISRLYLDDSFAVHHDTHSVLSKQEVEWLRNNVPDFRYVQG